MSDQRADVDLRDIMVMIDDLSTYRRWLKKTPITIAKRMDVHPAFADKVLFTVVDLECTYKVTLPPEWYLSLRSVAKSATYQQNSATKFGSDYSVVVSKADAAILVLTLTTE